MPRELTPTEWNLIVTETTDFNRGRWGHQDPDTGEERFWPAAVLARSRGAHLSPQAGPRRDLPIRLSPETVEDENILFEALNDIAYEFKKTPGRYLDGLEYLGKEIFKNNPRKDPK